MDILLIGPPGAGKGTQAEKLSQRFALRHIASGDLFHKAYEEQTELGLKARRYVDLGPCLIALRATVRFPRTLFGPVERRAFLRFA
jgi:adenylate kinase